MLKKILMPALITLGGIALLVIILYTYIYFNVKERINRRYENIPAEYYDVPGDSSAVALGDRLTMVKGCRDCHGKNLAGRILIDDPALGRIVTRNLTKGMGGLSEDFSDADWIKALRHGLGQDNKPLLLMPSEETTKLTQNDLMAIIAYCKSVPPVDHELPETDLNPLAYVLTYFDKFPLLSAEEIDHTKLPPKDIIKKVSIEYGQYLAVSCTGCHGPNFKGGAPIIPGSPPVADISATGHVGKWTEAQFIMVLRTGKTPEGKVLQNEFMPWKMTQAYTDEELKALYKFLKSKA